MIKEKLNQFSATLETATAFERFALANATKTPHEYLLDNYDLRRDFASKLRQDYPQFSSATEKNEAGEYEFEDEKLRTLGRDRIQFTRYNCYCIVLWLLVNGWCMQCSVCVI